MLKYSSSLRLTEVEVTQFQVFFFSPLPPVSPQLSHPSIVDITTLHLMNMASTQMLSSALWCRLVHEAAWSITDPLRAACVTSPFLFLLLLQSHSTKNTGLERGAPLYELKSTSGINVDKKWILKQVKALKAKEEQSVLSREASAPADPEAHRGTRRKQRVGDSGRWLCFKGQIDPEASLTHSVDNFAPCSLRTYQRGLRSRQCGWQGSERLLCIPWPERKSARGFLWAARSSLPPADSGPHGAFLPPW